MKPINFSITNTIYAEAQDEYMDLPAHRNEDGVVTTCWEMSLWERFLVLISGRVYLQTLTFGQALQPQKISIELPMAEK